MRTGSYIGTRYNAGSGLHCAADHNAFRHSSFALVNECSNIKTVKYATRLLKCFCTVKASHIDNNSTRVNDEVSTTKRDVTTVKKP